MIRGLEDHDLAELLRPKPQPPPAKPWSPPQTRERCVRDVSAACGCSKCRVARLPVFATAEGE